MTKAKDLQVGDEFTMMISFQVLAVEPAKTDDYGKRVKVKVALLEGGSTLFADDDDDLVVHLLCRPSRKFATVREGAERWKEWRKEWMAELDAGEREEAEHAGTEEATPAGPREQTKREQYAAAMAEKRRREAEAADGWVDFQSSFDREFQAGD